MFTDSYFDYESTSRHLSGSDRTLIITDDLDTIQIQRSLLSILNRIANSDAEAISVISASYCKTSKTGHLLEEGVRELSALKKGISENQQLHPTIQLFSTTLNAHNLAETLALWNISPHESDIINSWLKQFITEVKSASHKRKLRYFQRTASKNLAGALAYVDHLFEHHSRLLVIRVDLSYQKVNVKNNVVSADITRLHRKCLFKRVQSHSLFEHCLGYIWKLEYGQYKGFHYHTCFFFDACKVRADVTLARCIGEFWKKEITDGKGLYFNCNAIASHYAQSGIGDIHYTNHTKRSALQKAITYLAKVDTAVRLTLPKGGRTFGRSEYVVRQGKKRGRPRLAVETTGSRSAGIATPD
ncbi:inovirus Gp2 family protein [Citrobacter portucalensis]|uniref:YagK/YfjJ domain-containing protein n=1 Tax=Citrobacter portucalensis TaxID=1639133 RepID=UPI0023B2E2B9|nr:inovirus-type Gp2 protein [Citrobacter portucalensis]MDE9615433.1 inovirus Gp2 family protein [Citrobacter portucalensis]